MLETARLILSVGKISEAPQMLELNSDPEVTRYTQDPLHHLHEAENIIRERILPQWEKYKMGRFTVRLKDGTYIGWCGLRFFPEYDEVDLGYRLMRKYWGQGHATEASQAVLKYGFETLSLKRIMAKAVPENISSIKIMQKLGMTFRGYRNETHDIHSHVVYDLSLEEYRRCAGL